MKKILFLFISSLAFGQVSLYYQTVTQLPAWTLQGRTVLLTTDSCVYREGADGWVNVQKVKYYATSGGGSATDTTSLSNRINLKLNTADTTALHYVKLAGKLNTADTTNKWLPIGTALGGSGFTYSKRTADTSNSAIALVNIGNLRFNVTSGTYYYFKFVLLYSSAALTTGLRTALTTPTFTAFSASVSHAGQAVDGIANEWGGTINTSGDAVVSTAVAVINVNYVATIEGYILPSATGSIQLQIGSEVAASAITIRNGSFVTYQTY